MKTSGEIEKLLSISIANYKDTYVLIDSDELNKTGKMRLSDLLDVIHGRFVPEGLQLSTGEALSFDDGSICEVLLGAV